MTDLEAMAEAGRQGIKAALGLRDIAERERDYWRVRAERVEAAARAFDRCAYGYRTWCGNCPGCRLHLALAPAPGEEGRKPLITDKHPMTPRGRTVDPFEEATDADR